MSLRSQLLTVSVREGIERYHVNYSIESHRLFVKGGKDLSKIAYLTNTGAVRADVIP